jgi:hypothetical protein
MKSTATGRIGGRQLALLMLLACALLLKLPAGWMPEAHAGTVSIGWCNAVSPDAQAEAKALLQKALDDRPAPKHQSSADQPCSFAAAAQPMTAPNPLPELAPVAPEDPLFVAPLAALPGRGLAAPPPLSTGPPLLA